MLRSITSKMLFWLLIVFLLVLGPLALPVAAAGPGSGAITGDNMPIWVLLPLILGSLMGVHSLSRRRS